MLCTLEPAQESILVVSSSTELFDMSVQAPASSIFQGWRTPMECGHGYPWPPMPNPFPALGHEPFPLQVVRRRTGVLPASDARRVTTGTWPKPRRARLAFPGAWGSQPLRP